MVQMAVLAAADVRERVRPIVKEAGPFSSHVSITMRATGEWGGRVGEGGLMTSIATSPEGDPR